MLKTVIATLLKEWLHDGGEIALLDVREHGQYGVAHPFFAIPLPYSRLEQDIVRLVPRRSTRVVVYDDGSLGVAERAAHRLAALGYGNVHVLTEGTRGWAGADFALFAGVNVPSKAFGELVEHCYHTPRIGATELARRLAAREDIAVIDGRPFEEYRKMNIPGSRCCPNGELVYRIKDMVPDPKTRIVINCAGRTRSIIGAQTLIELGIPNSVDALENGTQGWELNDLELERDSGRRYPALIDSTDRDTLAARALELAARHGVRRATAEEVNGWLADGSRTTYVCDVRTSEEFAAGSIAGAVHAPGGQLLQATDQWVAVRNARIVVVDHESVRAPVIASWLRRMGHDAVVLEHGIAANLRDANIAPVELPEPESISPTQLHRMMTDRECKVIDLRPSMAYRKLHIPGSVWSIRPRLPVHELGRQCVVFVADEAGLAAIAAYDLACGVARTCFVLEGGFTAWQAARLPTERSPDTPPDSECIDYLFFVHDRHDGNKEAARRYLEWETHLIEQLDARERASFALGAQHAGA